MCLVLDVMAWDQTIITNYQQQNAQVYGLDMTCCPLRQRSATSLQRCYIIL